jgi:outer membrane receptor protein involved in Fe transport
MKLTKMKVAVLTALAAQAGFGAQTAIAQNGPALEEIVITSTRRETSVQDTPLAVTALSEEALAVQNIENTQDLTANVPNVLIYGNGRGSANGTFQMRGIPNVGTYVDGVWQVSQVGLLQRQFVELDRVEVLRGPQGTLVGRDSTGGSVQVYTKLPSEDFGGRLLVQAGSFNRRDVSGSVDIPIGDTLRTKWTIASYDKDGYVESVTTGQKHGELENQTVRGDILWTPTDQLSVRFIQQQDNQQQTTAGVQTFINPGVAQRFGWQVGIAEAHDIASLAIGGRGFNNLSQVGGYPGGQLSDYQNTKALTSPDQIKLNSTNLTVEYDMSETISLKYIYGDTTVNDELWTDYAGAQFNFFTNYDVAERDFESHEFQVNFDFDNFSLVLGYFNWKQQTLSRATEFSHSDWSFPEGWGGGLGGSIGGPPIGQTINAGIPQTLSYDDVLASPTCAKTPADYGYDFSSSDPNLNPSIKSGNGQFPTINPDLDPNTVAGWPRPCTAFNSWVPLFATVVGFNAASPAHDRGARADVDGDAIFGELTYFLTDAWDLTVGFRRHEQSNTNWNTLVQDAVAAGKVEARPLIWDRGFADPEGAVRIAPDSTSRIQSDFSKTTWKFGTSYDLNDDVMVYASYSEGFNSGGISTIADSLGINQIPFTPETIENTEFGVRGDFLDGSLRVNATYFMTDWVDIQAAFSTVDRATGDPITEVFTANASDGEARGLELELTYFVNNSLQVGANLGFLDTKYVNLKPGAQLTEDTEFGGAPDETYAVYADYNWNMFNGEISSRLSGNYFGNFWRSSIPNFRQDVYGGGSSPAGDIWRWNARAVYQPNNADWRITAFVNNIFEEKFLNSGFMDSIWQFDFSGVDAPREWGLGFEMNF